MTDLFAHLPVRPKLHVATPSYSGTVASSLEAMMLHLSGVCANQGVEFTRSVLDGTSILPMARNKLVGLFMESKDTHLLFIDADIICDPLDVLRMLASGHPLVGLPCSRRSIAWDRLCATAAKNPSYFSEHHEELLEAASVPNFEWMPGAEQVVVENGYADVAHVGTGCMLIAREVIETMAKTAPLVQTHQNMVPDPKPVPVIFDNFVDAAHQLYVGEDVNFCRRARELGYQPRILVTAKTRHVGAFEYRCHVLGELEAAKQEAT